jgi:hypothetical protein
MNQEQEGSMNVFGKLMDKIFNRGEEAPKTSAAPPRGNVAPPAAPSATAPSAPATATAVVDIESVLEGMAAKSGRKFNWRTSIVDLMTLVGMDSSLSERRELARELGYTGDTQDTATMNIWLHKQVMKKLAENGGKVPADLLD